MATRTVKRSTARVRWCSPAGASRSLVRPNRATGRLYPVGTTALGLLPGANCPQRIPRDTEDHEGNREADEGVGDQRAECYERSARDDAERNEAVD
jgi:hypothetical protein